MFRHIVVPLFLIATFETNLMLTSSISLGRLFPASRHRQRAASILDQTISGNFYRKPGILNSPKDNSKSSSTKFSLKSLPSFSDVIWKFNKNFIENKDSNVVMQEKPKKKFGVQSLMSLFSRVGDVYSTFSKSKLEETSKSEKIKLREASTTTTTTTTTTPAAPKEVKKKISGVTNSPIFYIKLPAVPYEYHPDLGYISRPPSPDFSNFLRPQVDFFNNGKPSKIYEPVTQDPAFEIVTEPPTTTFSTRTARPTSTTMLTTSPPSTTTPTSRPPSTITITTSPPSTTTPTSRPTSTITITTRPALTTTTRSSTTPRSTTQTDSTTSTTSFTPITTTIKNPLLGITNSPIIWLKGPYKFNGRPNNMFIFKSQPNKADRYKILHRLFAKPGSYLR